jgi:hypothetical protein
MSSTYVLLNKGKVVAVAPEQPYTGTPKMKEFPGITYDQAKQNGWDYKTFAEAEDIAAQLTEIYGVTWIAYDNGSGTSDQFGVMELPKVGDDVSYGFNGDYYPCGKIVRITKGLRIYTEDVSKSDGAHRQKCTFNRKGKTSGWKMVGGTWSLIKGIVDERNPHF